MIPIPSLGGDWMMRAIVTLIAATVPACIVWWADRRLLDKTDDPALPELLSSRRRTNVRAMAIGFAIVIAFGGGSAAWGLPLLLALLTAAAYPIRTRLLGETWGFGSYLWHTMLSVAGGFGFWILLAYAPGIVYRVFDALGRERWPLVAGFAAILAIGLMVLEEWFPRVWLWSHSATPLTDPILTPRFQEIVARAGTVSPAVYRVGPQGSRFVNAVALPSVRRPSVAMGTALLELLDPDETTAIFAHEIAHFDHLTPKRIRRAQLVNRLLIVAGVSIPFLTTFVTSGELRWLGWAWPFAVLYALARRAAKSQQHETESDLRAAALCGNPEALVRGLVKLHLHARIPRRYAVDVERAATHPSLVRRIQAIRAGGPAAVEQLGAATVLRSTRAGSWVVLDADRAYWLEGVPEGTTGELTALREAASSYRALNYGDLVELRVSAAGESRTLAARVRGGESWVVPIAIEDVARVQQTLDIVDLRLGKAVAGPVPGLTKIIPLAALTAALIAGQIGVLAIPILLAFWKPGAAVFAALGAMSVVRAALGLVEGSSWLDEQTVRLGLAALAAIGVGAMYTASRLAKSGEGKSHVRFVLMTLGVTALAITVALVQMVIRTSTPLVGVSLVSALGTLIVGIAATTFLVQARWRLAAALGGIVVGVAVTTVGVDMRAWSLRRVLTETTASATPDGELDLGASAGGLRVSPNGEHFLVVRMPVGRRPGSRQAAGPLLGRFGGSVRELSAMAAEFIDDDRLFVIDVIDNGMELRIESVDSAVAPLWADTLADVSLAATRIVIDRDSSAWAIIGEDTDNDRTTVLAGTIGVKGSTRRAAIPDTLAMVGEPIVFGRASTVIVPTYSPQMRGRGVSALWALPLMGMDPLRADLWRIRGDTVKHLTSMRGVPQCGDPANGVAACVRRHMKAASLYTISATGEAREIAQLPSPDLGIVSLGPGARATSMRFDRSIQVIDFAALRLTKFPAPAASDYSSEVRVAGEYIITLSYSNDRRSIVRRYKVRN